MLPLVSEQHCWAPEDILDQLNGIPVPGNLTGMALLLEVGAVDRGWILDFRSNTVVLGRYDVPASNKKRLPPKLPGLPPNVPWLWYKDMAVFFQIGIGEIV